MKSVPKYRIAGISFFMSCPYSLVEPVAGKLKSYSNRYLELGSPFLFFLLLTLFVHTILKKFL